MADFSPNQTKQSMRSLEGATRLTRAYLKPPDTLVKLPNGETLVLPRSGQAEATPAFRKYNPRKIQPRSKHKPFQRPRTVPFSKFLMIGFALHQAVCLVRSLMRKYHHRKALAVGEDISDDEDDSVASVEEELQPQSDMLPAMMRQAMPRPERKNLAQRRAEAHHSRPRRHTTAKQMRMPSSNVRQRKPGKLELMEKASREQVRATLLSQQRVNDQLRLKYEGRSAANSALPTRTANPTLPSSATNAAPPNSSAKQLPPPKQASQPTQALPSTQQPQQQPQQQQQHVQGATEVSTTQQVQGQQQQQQQQQQQGGASCQTGSQHEHTQQEQQSQGEHSQQQQQEQQQQPQPLSTCS